MSESPKGFRTRAPTVDDAEAVAGLLAACDEADDGGASLGAKDLLTIWEDHDLAQDAVVMVASDGRIVGYADVLNEAFVAISVHGYVHPDLRGRGIGASLVAWGESWARDHISKAPAEARVVVQHYVLFPNRAKQNQLEGAGYEPVRTLYEMSIHLDEQTPPSPEWPTGTSVRTFVPGRDERAVHEAVEGSLQDAWGRPPRSFKDFVGVTRRETFDPSLWFVASDGGVMAGVALCRVVDGEGWVDAVGVRRPWRGQGLGLALLQHAFAAYRQRGVRTVKLGVDSESATGAPRLYGRAGMRVAASCAGFRRNYASA